MSLKIVFMGTPEFSVPTLEILLKNKFEILSVYTQPPKKSKRGQKINISPIQELSAKNKITFRTPNTLNNEEEYNLFNRFNLFAASSLLCPPDKKAIPGTFSGTLFFST